MYSSVIKKFEGKIVEITTAYCNFVGILDFHKSEDLLELTPVKPVDIKKYGPAFIDQNAVLAIRIFKIKPNDEDKGYIRDNDDSYNELTESLSSTVEKGENS